MKKLGIIELLRGIAALFVCLFHFGHCNIQFVGSSHFFKDFFSFGWVGVEIFFVISGFIIPYSMLKSNYRIKHFFKFLIKRIVRIEPPYIVSIILVLLLGLLSSLSIQFNGIPQQINFVQILSHLLYLTEHIGFEWLQPVYWTLEIEFHFYILIALFLPLIWESKYSFVTAIFVLCLTQSFIPLTIFKFSSYFAIGLIALGYALEKITKRESLLLILIVIIWLCYLEQSSVMIAASFSTVLAIMFLKIHSKHIDYLGKISFSLYLIHIPIGGRVINFLGRYAKTESDVWMTLGIALIITLGFSWMFYKIIETPSQILSRKIKYKN
jgi:peptidoglycan/LPS O-acetylase OafA/YrhL